MRASTRSGIAGVLLLGLFAAFALGHAPQAQAQSACSMTYDATKYFCAPPVPGEWEYFWSRPSGAWNGPFPSEGAVIAHAEASMGASVCSQTFTHINHDTSTPEIYAGVVNYRRHRMYLDMVAHSDSNPPCTQTWSEVRLIRLERAVGCPKSVDHGADWGLIHAGGGLYYCRVPWTKAFERRCGLLCKGNPVDVLTGTKIQREVD
jgi:hypothetical protein